MKSLAAEMQDLQRDAAAGLAHRASDQPVRLYFVVAAQREAALGGLAGLVRRAASADDQADALARAQRVERRHPFPGVVALVQIQVHRAHQQPVGQPQPVQLDRREQPAEQGPGFRHTALHRPPARGR
ncbi:hypothetical protein ABD440_11235 [Chromobacterium piscinae]